MIGSLLILIRIRPDLLTGAALVVMATVTGPLR